jgi:hypothetical protein
MMRWRTATPLQTHGAKPAISRFTEFPHKTSRVSQSDFIISDFIIGWPMKSTARRVQVSLLRQPLG